MKKFQRKVANLRTDYTREKRGPKPPPLSFCDVFMVPGRRVLVVEKCVRHADIWRGKRRATTTTPGCLPMKRTPRPISCSRRYRRFSRARKDSGSLQGGMRKRKRIGQNRNNKRREHLKGCSRLCRTYELKPLNALIQTFYSLCPYSFYYKADKIYKTLQSPKSNRNNNSIKHRGKIKKALAIRHK